MKLFNSSKKKNKFVSKLHLQDKKEEEKQRKLKTGYDSLDFYDSISES